MQRLNSVELSGYWFAAQVFAGRERQSATHLLSRGYDVFLPCYQEHRRWSDRIKTIERALFSGYLFCRLHGDVFGQVITAPGVIGIVGDGQRPIPISEDEIEAVRRMVATDLGIVPWAYPQVGQRVRVIAGPLQDVTGVVLRAKNGHRLVVSISLLQRSVAVEVPLEWLEAIPDEPWSRPKIPARRGWQVADARPDTSRSINGQFV